MKQIWRTESITAILGVRFQGNGRSSYQTMPVEPIYCEHMPGQVISPEQPATSGVVHISGYTYQEALFAFGTKTKADTNGIKRH